jgi:hypothetical protein
MIDGALEIGKGVWDLAKFIECYNPVSFHAWTGQDCHDTRTKTYDVLTKIASTFTDLTKFKAAIGGAYSGIGSYFNETIGLDNQARYNQGKAIFNVASFFVGIGEANAVLKGQTTLAAVVKATLKSYANLPKTLVKLAVRGTKKAATGSLKGLVYIAEKTGSKTFSLYINLNVEIRLADLTAKNVLTEIKWLEGQGSIVEKLNNVSYIDKAGKAKTANLEIVKDSKNNYGFREVVLKGAWDLNTAFKNTEFKKIYEALKNGDVKRVYGRIFNLEEEALIHFYQGESYYKFNKALVEGSTLDDIITIEIQLNNTLD